ncbi:MAG: 2Fe-2S iron-sulfur cluster-binding protein [Nocardioides sp.]
MHVLSREQQDIALLSGRLDADRLRRLVAELVPDHVTGVDGWFICGPQQMVVELRPLVVDGADPRAVHTELFHADPVSRPRPSLEGVSEGAAAVTIRMDGRSSDLTLRPDGPSVLEAALAVRPDLPFACRGGVCGTCRAKLLEGTVDLDAAWALEPGELEQGYVLTCQAHPTSPRVVLDYDG